MPSSASAGPWVYTLAETAEGATILTIAENGYVDSLLFRGVGALLMDPHDSINDFLTDLGKSFGESTSPEIVR